MNPKLRQQVFLAVFIAYTIVIGVMIMRSELAISTTAQSNDSEVEVLDTAKLDKIQKTLSTRSIITIDTNTTATPSGNIEFGKAEPFR